MSAAALLFWMSARRQGSWQQFRAAVEELQLNPSNDAGDDEDGSDPFALPIYQTLRFNLQRVGHAEFFSGAEDAEWRVTPPSLAVTQQPWGSRGILVGARSLLLLQRLTTAAGQAGVKLTSRVFPDYPDQVVVTADDQSALAAIAKRTGLLLQCDVSAAILLSLPPISDPCMRHPTQLPFGPDWQVGRFSTSTLGWQSATLSDAASASGSLFRFTLRHQRDVLFCERGSAFRVPAQVGKYIAFRSERHRRHVLRYNGQTHTLSMPAPCRPPFLIERALIACSASPPALQGGTLIYTEIPQNIALIVAALLHQELR